MNKKRHFNRRTKLEIAEATAMKTLVAAGIEAESEEGQKLLTQVRENLKNSKTTKTDPDLSEAKKARLKAKRFLEKLNTAAKTFSEIQTLLTTETIEKAIADFNSNNNKVKELGGEEITAITKDLQSFMDR